MNKAFEYIKQVAKIPSIYPNEAQVRKFIIEQLESKSKKYKTDKFGNLYILPENESQILLCAHMDKQAPPHYIDLNTHIKGKLDDAVGIGIILALCEKNDFYGFFTVGEEVNQIGSRLALKEGLIPNVDKAIVIDTSSTKKMGNGPVFYTSFSGIYPSEDFITSIFSVAKSLDINLQPIPGFINDGIILIQAIKNTIALEPHINHYHTSMEISLKKDIIDTYRVIEKVLNYYLLYQ